MRTGFTVHVSLGRLILLPLCWHRGFLVADHSRTCLLKKAFVVAERLASTPATDSIARGPGLMKDETGPTLAVFGVLKKISVQSVRIPFSSLG